MRRKMKGMARKRRVENVEKNEVGYACLYSNLASKATQLLYSHWSYTLSLVVKAKQS